MTPAEIPSLIDQQTRLTHDCARCSGEHGPSATGMGRGEWPACTCGWLSGPDQSLAQHLEVMAEGEAEMSHERDTDETRPHTHPGTCDNPDPLSEDNVNYAARFLFLDDFNAGVEVDWAEDGWVYRAHVETVIAALDRRGLLLCSAKTKAASE